MESINLNIAYQVRTALLEDKETVMALRGMQESQINLFFRNDALQKLTFDDVCYNLIGNSFEDEDDDFDGIPLNVYKNLCSLIFNDIKQIQQNLNHRHIVIDWKYDSKLEAFTGTSLTIRRDIHFPRR